MLADPLCKLAGSGPCGSLANLVAIIIIPSKQLLSRLLPVSSPNLPAASIVALLEHGCRHSLPLIRPCHCEIFLIATKSLRARSSSPISSVLHRLCSSISPSSRGCPPKPQSRFCAPSADRPPARSSSFLPRAPPPPRPSKPRAPLDTTTQLKPPAVLPSARCNLPTWLPSIPRPLAQLLTLWP